MNTETTKSRLFFLDNLKVLFTILVIFQHVRVTYGGTGGWYYIEAAPSDLASIIFFTALTSIGGLFQASLMGLFFLMGGYFTPKSYDRKGVRSFWKERLLRLGIPLLLYIFLINPILRYIPYALGIPNYGSYATPQGSFLDYYLSQFQSLEAFIGFLTSTGPMWFLYVLLIFTIVYTIWRQITKIDLIQRRIPKEFSIPKYFYLLLVAISLGFLTFLFRLVSPIDAFPFGMPFGFFAIYLMMFSVGVICVRYDWIGKMRKHHVKAWAITILAAFILLNLYVVFFVGFDSDLSVFLGGPNLSALAFAMAENIISMGMIFVLLKIFYAKFNDQGSILKNLSSSAFYMYLIHPIVLVPVSLGFAYVPLFPVIKLVLVFPITVIFCYLLSHYILEKIQLKKPTRVT
ncbi:MAG: acyltransferase [Candidatus Lokiarchaeota archaeon]|nr:acyltransferase [Candidatus Lokiarchaeota archaeon]